MTRISVTYISPRACKDALALLVSAIILAGCSSYSVVPTKDLSAERAEQQALRVKQQKLSEEVRQLQTIRANLESRLAAEARRRKALEAREAEVEQALKAQRAAEQALASLEQKCEKLQEQDRLGHAHSARAREDDNARLYLLLLEKKAQIDSLTGQLEAAILEVVRTKAKLRSVDSKAEAASNLAEAEIAVETLKSRGERWQRDPGVVKAVELNGLSAVEFRKGNYGGALYLTGEAKNVIRGAQVRSQSQEMSSTMDGEVAFALPLPLRLLEESEVREGPGDQFKALFSSGKGAPLTAYSYLGQWVRVSNNAGDHGWVFYKRLANPN